MYFHPRSEWTALPPKNGIMADTYIGMPFFERPPVGIEFIRANGNLLYVNRNPIEVLSSLLKEAVNRTGYSDINFNYAIVQNVPGAFVLRGGGTKCRDSRSLRVLMLLGANEQPTDLLKENQKTLLENKNRAPGAVLRPGDQSVHVFDLIEFLIEKGLYQARNDGVYGPFCEQAVHRLQLEMDCPEFDGVYGTWLINRLHRTASYVHQYS